MPVGRTRPGTFVANTVGLGFAVIMAFPVYWMINTALKPPNEVQTFEPVFFRETSRGATSPRR